MIPVLGSQEVNSQPTEDSMHSHEPGDGLSPPSTTPTATHMHIINPAVGLQKLTLT